MTNVSLLVCKYHKPHRHVPRTYVIQVNTSIKRLTILNSFYLKSVFCTQERFNQFSHVCAEHYILFASLKKYLLKRKSTAKNLSHHRRYMYFRDANCNTENIFKFCVKSLFSWVLDQTLLSGLTPVHFTPLG